MLFGKEANVPLEQRTHSKFRVWYRKLLDLFVSWQRDTEKKGQLRFPRQKKYTLLEMVILLVKEGAMAPAPVRACLSKG